MSNFKMYLLGSLALLLLAFGIYMSFHSNLPKYQAGDCVRLLALGSGESAGLLGEIKIISVIDSPKMVKAINANLAKEAQASRYYDIGIFDQEDDSLSMGFYVSTEDIDNYKLATTFWRDNPEGGADDGCRKQSE